MTCYVVNNVLVAVAGETVESVVVGSGSSSSSCWCNTENHASYCTINGGCSLSGDGSGNRSPLFPSSWKSILMSAEGICTQTAI